MTDSPESSPSAAAPRASRPRRIGSAFLFAATTVVVWLTLLSFPFAPGPGLDPSWQLLLNRAWSQRLIFGRDIIFSYGPWGWLTTVFYYPTTLVPHLAWNFGWTALVSLLIVRLASVLSWPRRILLIAATLLLLPLFGETLPMLVVSGLFLWVVRSKPLAPLFLAGIVILFGLLALQKFTSFVMIACGLGAVGLELARRRDWRAAGWLAGSLLASTLGWWLATGQELAAFPLFLRGSAIFAAGYAEAMFLDETAQVFRFGLATALVFLWVAWDRPSRQSLPVSLLLIGLGFLSWKYGFVRADGHVLGFFFAMLVAGLAAPLYASGSARRLWGSWLLCLLAVSGAYASNPPLFRNVWPLLRYHLNDSTRNLFSLGDYRKNLERRYAAAEVSVQLPLVQSRVGDARIDQFGYEQTTLLWNHLNYAARPIMQGYQVYSGALAAYNDNFYRSSKAPAFTLARLQTIDGRFPALDDAALLPRLVTDHDFVLSEDGFLLLQHRPKASALALQSLASGKLRYGTEEYKLPGGGAGIWARLDAPLSWLGVLRAILYKPPEVTLVIRNSSGVESRFRLVVPAARAGFLLSPMLVETGDLERLLTMRAGRTAQSIRLEIRPGDAIFFLKRARYEILALPALNFLADDKSQLTTGR